ncbi:MAG TPA: SusC/RagA family TonB-linked outer membrane protein, partial [Porphyromonadaceae bacterium]|nr:SusC/RagA family TonB-linked outer membrane protein [Porphyromonadaceae bacterium]
LQDRLTMSLNIATNFNDANLLGGGTGDFEQAIQRNPTAPLYNEDGTFFETEAFNNYNPISRLANRLSKRNQQTTSADLRLQLQLLENWSVAAFGSYDRNTYNNRYYRSSKDWENRVGTDYQGMGYASKENYLDWRKTFEMTTDYRKTFNHTHTITAMAGYSYQYYTFEKFNVNNNGFTTDAFEDWNLGAGSAINNTKLPRPGMGSEKQDNTLVAFFGRINYSYADKYHLQGILRHEGSSRFGANHKWGNFPAVSAGWTISEE